MPAYIGKMQKNKCHRYTANTKCMGVILKILWDFYDVTRVGRVPTSRPMRISIALNAKNMFETQNLLSFLL